MRIDVGFRAREILTGLTEGKTLVSKPNTKYASYEGKNIQHGTLGPLFAFGFICVLDDVCILTNEGRRFLDSTDPDFLPAILQKRMLYNDNELTTTCSLDETYWRYWCGRYTIGLDNSIVITPEEARAYAMKALREGTPLHSDPDYRVPGWRWGVSSVLSKEDFQIVEREWLKEQGTLEKAVQERMLSLASINFDYTTDPRIHRIVRALFEVGMELEEAKVQLAKAKAASA